MTYFGNINNLTKEYVMLKNWQDLPSSGDSREEVSNFFKELSVEEVAAYMTAVLNEWKNIRIYGIGDQNDLEPKELPLIRAFKEKVNMAHRAYYHQLLGDFKKSAGNKQAKQIAEELQW